MFYHTNKKVLESHVFRVCFKEVASKHQTGFWPNSTACRLYQWKTQKVPLNN